jgi:GYF domain 2
MGIKFYCPNGHKMHVKDFLAGKRGLCPKCGVRVEIPMTSVSGPPPEVHPAEEQLAEEGGLMAESAAAKLNATKTLPTKASPVFGMAADEAAVDSLLAETVGEEVAPVEQPASADELADVEGSAAGMLELQVEMPAAAAEPLQIPPGDDWYVHLANGKQMGPVGSDTLRQWLDQAVVGVDALVWRSGWDQWQVIREAFATNRVEAAVTPGVNSTPIEVPEHRPIDSPAVVSQGAGKRRYRSKTQFSLTASLCLLGLVVLLFVILLFVFFKRSQPAPIPSTEVPTDASTS